jgi:hypothetical protein
MTRQLTVKKEIRTLGLDLCNPRPFVGAVVRGGSYLDGVMVFPSEPSPKSRQIAKTVVGTRFFPELRLIMTHDPKVRLDVKVLEAATKLPVIQIDSTRKKGLQAFTAFEVGGNRLLAKSSLPSQLVQAILITTWTVGSLPEPLRIAHAIARSSYFRERDPFSSQQINSPD